MPFLNEAVIRAEYEALGDFDVVVPWPRKRPQFLHAFYRSRCLGAIKESLDADCYKVEAMTQRCKTLRLNGDWFRRHGLADAVDLAFANINTFQDFCRWGGTEAGGCVAETAGGQHRQSENNENGVLRLISAGVLEKIRETLIAQESAYQQQSAEEAFSSIWTHSSRVGRIAFHIAREEGFEKVPALLAGLLHDIGKFAHGTYHENETPEEENAARIAERLLAGTEYAKWIPVIQEAVLTTYLEGKATSDIGRAVYDADCLDKLGNMGVVQFFAKKALRRQFLDDEVLIKTSIELTYAHHAPDTLKTATGRALARERSTRTRRFYTELLAEWRQLGLGDFFVAEEEIAGIVCILVVPRTCRCGGRLAIESDIQDAVKCRSVVVTYRCAACNVERDFSFCLPNVKGLPLKTAGE
jgi:uncharacterized protein